MPGVDLSEDSQGSSNRKDYFRSRAVMALAAASIIVLVSGPKNEVDMQEPNLPADQCRGS